MSIESHDDLDGVREAGRITTAALDAMAAHLAEGITTAELDEVASAVLDQNGARSAPAMVYGFPGTVLISAGSSYPMQGGDGWTLRTRDGSLAAHCAHTLVITRGEPMILAA